MKIAFNLKKEIIKNIKESMEFYFGSLITVLKTITMRKNG